MERLKADVEKNPDDYQYKRAKRFKVSQNVIYHALMRLKVSYKKSLFHPKADASAREAFKKKIKDYQANGKPIVYIDESGFSHDMPRKHGYSAKGKRCYGKHDWHSKGRTNVI